MDIKKLAAISMIVMCPLFVAQAQAGQVDDICSKIPGHWDGIFTLKDQADCKRHNGCTHLVSADISYISGNDYFVNLNAAVGNSGEFNIQCEDGIIKSPVNPGNSIAVTCNSKNHCFVVYDDPRLTSEMKKD